MYNAKSDYALNKLDQASIVYQDAEGHITRLTRPPKTSAFTGAVLFLEDTDRKDQRKIISAPFCWS